MPEGTAAKKLHCHQHVKPPDPREFVPDLPLDVVHILDRMMAKQPRDRFQTPEDLVKQLLVVAGKLGISTEVPEGVLILEAPISNRPVGRPLLWGALAIVAVVALVLLVDQAPTGQGDPRKWPAVGAEITDAGTPGKTAAAQPKQEEDPPPVPASETEEKALVYVPPDEPSVQHLMEWLEEHQGAAQDRGAATRGTQSVGSRAWGRRPDSPRPAEGDHQTLRSEKTLEIAFHLSRSAGSARRTLIALSMHAPEVEIEGIHFVVDARGSEAGIEALHLKGDHVTVRGCEFFQVQPSLRDVGKRLASVVVEGAGKPRPEAVLRDCVFLGFGGQREADKTLTKAEMGGQDAVVRLGAVRSNVESCVFGPHSAAFHLKGNSGDEDAVTVQHCSVLLAARRSSVFKIDKQSSARLDVSQSLFSRMAGDTDSEGAVLLRQADNLDTAVSYQGRGNCYHDLDGYWCDGSDWKKADWSDFLQKSRNGRGQDDSRVLVFNPWQLEPAEQVRELEEQNFDQAFGIRLKLAALRQGRDRSEVVGAESILGKHGCHRRCRCSTKRANRLSAASSSWIPSTRMIASTAFTAVSTWRCAAPGQAILS